MLFVLRPYLNVTVSKIPKSDALSSDHLFVTLTRASAVECGRVSPTPGDHQLPVDFQRKITEQGKIFYIKHF